MASTIYGCVMGKEKEAINEWEVVETTSQDKMKDYRGTAHDESLKYRPGHNTIASHGGELGGCKKPSTPRSTSCSKYFPTTGETCQDCGTHHRYFNLGVGEVSWGGEPAIASERHQSEDQVEDESTEESRLLSTTLNDNAGDLLPCSSCNSYHYAKKCIYLLPWTQWLEYHSKHMSSQAYPSPDSLPSNKLHERRRLRQAVNPETAEDGEMALLRERARHLDAIEDIHRPNYISNTRLKADLMTNSSRDMFYEDEKWNAKLRKRATYVKTSSGTANQARRLLHSDHSFESSDQSSEDDEDALATLKADLGRSLPRTSRASIFDEGVF